MKEVYEPPPDFTERVMKRIKIREARQFRLPVRFDLCRPIRLALTCGGTFIGILGAAPVF